jgi:Doublecortin
LNNTRRAKLVTNIFKSGRSEATVATVAAPVKAPLVRVNTQTAKDQQQEQPKRFFESSMMNSADAGNNNNTIEMDKTTVNSDGQALGKSGAILSEKKLNGSSVASPAATPLNNNITTLPTSKSSLNLKPESPEEDGYSIGSGLNKALNQDPDFYPQAREKSAAASRWGIRGPGSPGSPEPSSRPQSPSMDNYSDIHGGPSRPKSRQDMPGSSSGVAGGGMAYPNSRFNVSNFWKARRILFYRNGDPFFPAVEFRFKPGRDISTLDKLLDKISSRMDLPRGARYIFSMDGDRKTSLDELEDGSSYVVSSFKQFKVSK